MTLQITSKW